MINNMLDVMSSIDDKVVEIVTVLTDSEHVMYGHEIRSGVAEMLLNRFTDLKSLVTSLEEMIHDARDFESSASNRSSMTSRVFWKQKISQISLLVPDVHRQLAELAEELDGRKRWKLLSLARDVRGIAT